MNWKLVLFAAIIILLYVPLTIVGVNTFFPEYAQDSYSQCDAKNAYPLMAAAKDPAADAANQAAIQDWNVKMAKCREDWDKAKNEYESQKYIAIMILNVLVLLLVVLVSMNESIHYGLFIGVAISSFISVISYNQTRSKLGFIVLVVIFALMVWFISKEKNLWVKKGKK